MRAGRQAEAIRALRPFVDGENGHFARGQRVETRSQLVRIKGELLRPPKACDLAARVNARIGAAAPLNRRERFEHDLIFLGLALQHNLERAHEFTLDGAHADLLLPTVKRGSEVLDGELNFQWVCPLLRMISATSTALRAAPFRTLSATIQSCTPCSTEASDRIRPTYVASVPTSSAGTG